MTKLFSVAGFGTPPKFYAVDDRIGAEKYAGAGTLQFDYSRMTLNEKGNDDITWKPYCIVPCGERLLPDDARKVAQAIADHLNTQWVKEKLTS